MQKMDAPEMVAPLATTVSASPVHSFLAMPKPPANVEPPAAFAVEGRPDLGEVQGWVDGVLPETKFRHFRLDLRLGVV